MRIEMFTKFKEAITTHKPCLLRKLLQRIFSGRINFFLQKKKKRKKNNNKNNIIA